MEKKHIYDMIIIGGGPGGYTAALYAARAGLDTLILEKYTAGGQMALTHQIDNYPGFSHGIDGFSLAENMQKQALRFGANSVTAQVTDLQLKGQIKQVTTTDGSYFAKTVVIATGAGPKQLGLAEEDALVGKGVAYCAACDGMFYRGKTVVVAGGGNTAVADALLLSRIAEKVILVHRRDTFRAEKIYLKALQEAKNVEIRRNSQITRLVHEDKLTGVVVLDKTTGEAQRVDCQGLFVSVGRLPATELLKNSLSLDPGGYILAGEDTKTELPGVYAVGDVRTKQVRQIVTAVADGAVAVHQAEVYLSQEK